MKRSRLFSKIIRLACLAILLITSCRAQNGDQLLPARLMQLKQRSGAAATVPRLWGRLKPGRYAVGLHVERFDSQPGRSLELVTWYPAVASAQARPLQFAEYLKLAPELLGAETSNNTASLHRSLAIAINSEPESIATKILDEALTAPMLAVRDATELGRQFPLVLWSARHATSATQAVLNEYLASQGYVVAFARLVGAPMPLPYEIKEPEAKRTTLNQHVRDLQAAFAHLSQKPNVAPARSAVLTWSYAGESALRLQQQEPRIKCVISLSSNPLANWVYQNPAALTTLDATTLRATYILLTERLATNGTVRTPPDMLKTLPTGAYFAVFPELAHGNFNALEGLIPAVLGVDKVQRWSKAGPAAQLGYETVARLTHYFLDSQLKQLSLPPVKDWLQTQKLPNDFVTVEQFVPRKDSTQHTSQPLTDEIARLKQVLVVLPESDAAAFRPVLEQAEQEVRANRPLAAFFRLQRSAAQIAALQYRATHKKIETRGIEAFDANWQGLGPELAAREKQLAALPRALSNAVAHAFAEASLTKVKPLYQAAKLYAREDTIASGLYYLGQTLGLLDFALYCRRLALAPTHPALALRSFAPELAELEKDVLAAYSKADVTAQQGLYNQLHATLKTAQDLNQERRYAGALFQYLEARRVLGLLKPSATPPTATDLQSKSAVFQTQLAGRKHDDSLALLYWEVAQSALGSGLPDNLPMAAVILNEVLPRYFKLIPE